MGRQYIDGFLEQGIDIETALKIHLQGNHYPPVHTDFIPACIESINAFQDEDYNKKITLPNGRILMAHQVVKGLHLDSFLECDED